MYVQYAHRHLVAAFSQTRGRVDRFTAAIQQWQKRNFGAQTRRFKAVDGCRHLWHTRYTTNRMVPRTLLTPNKHRPFRRFGCAVEIIPPVKFTSTTGKVDKKNSNATVCNRYARREKSTRRVRTMNGHETGLRRCIFEYHQRGRAKSAGLSAIQEKAETIVSYLAADEAEDHAADVELDLVLLVERHELADARRALFWHTHSRFSLHRHFLPLLRNEE